MGDRVFHCMDAYYSPVLSAPMGVRRGNLDGKQFQRRRSSWSSPGRVDGYIGGHATGVTVECSARLDYKRACNTNIMKLPSTVHSRALLRRQQWSCYSVKEICVT